MVEDPFAASRRAGADRGEAKHNARQRERRETTKMPGQAGPFIRRARDNLPPTISRVAARGKGELSQGASGRTERV
jgi:hypothetical protein